MHEMHSECHLGVGIFMECRIRNIVPFFLSTIIILLLFLWFSEYKYYKTILLYEYSFESESDINKEFYTLGFRYKKNFAECPEKTTFTGNIEIQCYTKNGKHYILLYYKSEITNHIIKSILNNKSDIKIFMGNFPDDFYKQYFSEIFEWSLNDRKIYLAEFDNIKKVCIEKTNNEKNPTIINPHWENADGQTITKALVGDEVYLCADVTDIADGATATIKIVEKDDDGKDDDLTILSDKVQNGKIRCDWKVVYMEDNDDTESQQEMEEKGYTLPEYAFTVECGGVKSDESPQLDVMGCIRTQFKDKRTGKPIANHKYTIYLFDGTTKNGITNSEGFVYEKDLKHGKYYIEFGE